MIGSGYLLAALLLLSPALGPGALLNLDLVITRHADVGGGMWGLGPELPRLGPLEVPLGLLGSLSSGWIVKWVLVLAPALAATGTHRLARLAGASMLPAAGAGLMFGFGPWMMTRVTVGHIAMVGAAAALPWVIRPFLDQRAGRRLVVASATLATFGFYGGLVALVLVVAAAAGTGTLPSRSLLVRFVAPQMVWLVPGALVLASVGNLGGGNLFPSGVDELADTPALLAGYGFWQDRFQVGGDPGVLASAIGALLAVVAFTGLRTLSRPLQRATAFLITVPLVLVAAATIPGIRAGFGVLTGVGPLAAVREPQRLMVVALLAVSVGAALGVDVVKTRVSETWGPAIVLLPLTAATVLVAPAVPHVRDRLEPVLLPDEWAEARSAITTDPGSVLVLPFDRYLNFGLAGGRRSLNPALFYFAPWAIVSSELGLDETSSERADPREPTIVEAVERLRGQDHDASVLAGLGIDWVLILHEIDYEPYLVLLDDPALEHKIAAGSLDLFRVRDGTGPAVDISGERARVNEILQPLLRVEGEGAVTLDRPYQWGWLRGLNPAERGPDGRLVARGSSQWIWYWPAVVVVTVDVGIVGLLGSWLLLTRLASNAPGGGTSRRAFPRFASFRNRA